MYTMYYVLHTYYILYYTIQAGTWEADRQGRKAVLT